MEYMTCRNVATIIPVLLSRDLEFHEIELDGQEKLHDDTEEVPFMIIIVSDFLLPKPGFHLVLT